MAPTKVRVQFVSSTVTKTQLFLVSGDYPPMKTYFWILRSISALKSHSILHTGPVKTLHQVCFCGGSFPLMVSSVSVASHVATVSSRLATFEQTSAICSGFPLDKYRWARVKKPTWGVLMRCWTTTSLIRPKDVSSFGVSDDFGGDVHLFSFFLGSIRAIFPLGVYLLRLRCSSDHNEVITPQLRKGSQIRRLSGCTLR